MIWGRWGADGFRTESTETETCTCDLAARACGTDAYYNGGVEGRAFDIWYNRYLAAQYAPAKINTTKTAPITPAALSGTNGS